MDRVHEIETAETRNVVDAERQDELSPCDELSLCDRFCTIFYRESALTRKVQKKVKDRMDSRNRLWMEKTWQTWAAAEVLGGHDSIVVTATGSGKTMCY